MWWHRFTNRMDAYSVQGFRDRELQYFSQYWPLSPELFNAHLTGVLTLGLPAVNGEGLSRWGCFDSDTDSTALERIEKVLSDHGWHSLREGARPGRAGHLWVFFEKPVCARDLRLFAQRIMQLAGVPGHSIEFFPKQDKAEYDTEKRRFRVCSVVRLPFGVHRKPDADGFRGWFAGVPQDTATQIAWLERQPMNPTDPIEKAAPALRQLAAIANPPTVRNENAVDPNQVIEALTYVSPDSYETWYRVGMAVKTAGLDLAIWDQWSQRSAKYKPGMCAQKWASFPLDGRVGVGTIFHFAKENGYSFSDLSATKAFLQCIKTEKING